MTISNLRVGSQPSQFTIDFPIKHTAYLSSPGVHVPMFINVSFRIPRPTGPDNVSSVQLYMVVAISMHTFRMFTFCLMEPATWAPAIGIGAQQERNSHANNITSTWTRRAGLADPAASPRPRPGASLGRCARVLRARDRSAAAAPPVASSAAAAPRPLAAARASVARQLRHVARGASDESLGPSLTYLCSEDKLS